jgi:N6-adenosine-specific RNA methylase IME4
MQRQTIVLKWRELLCSFVKERERHMAISSFPQFIRSTAAEDLSGSNLGQFGTILADPPWQFTNRTGKMAPEHRRLLRYPTMTLEDILNLPIAELSLPQSHLYLWVPNALLAEGLEVMKRWGFTYKTNLVWYKVRKDGGPDGRGVGFYFRNVTELVLFGTRGSLRTLPPGRRQVNIISTRKREHSRKPDEQYNLIEQCSPEPYLELFARHQRASWSQWGNEIAAIADQIASESEYAANVLFPEFANIKADETRRKNKVTHETPIPVGECDTPSYTVSYAAKSKDA